MAKPKVNAFYYTKRKSWCVLFSYHAAYAAHICICTSCINVYILHSSLHISCLSIHAHTAPQTLQVRGGSVSRRGHAQHAGNRAQLAGGNTPKRTAPAKRHPLFGRGGLGERRFSQRSGLSPRISQSKQSLRKGARGRGLLYREAPSLAKKILSEVLTKWEIKISI